MAAFIAKQVVGKQFDSVKGALGDKDEEKKSDCSPDEDPEVAEAKREAEEKRNEKFRKQEEERERMRQDIRDKYGLRKKETLAGDEEDLDDATDAGRTGRKSKSADIATGSSEPGCQHSDSGFPRSLSDLSAKVSDLPGKMAATVNDATDKCLLQ